MERTIGVGDGCRPIVASSVVVSLIMGCWQWVTGSSVIDGERRPRDEMKKKEKEIKEKENMDKKKESGRREDWGKRG